MTRKDFFFSIALFAVGACALVFRSGYSVGFYFICFGGIYVWSIDRDRLISNEAKYFLIPIAFYGIFNIIHGLTERTSSRLIEDNLPFIIIIFGFFALRKVKPSLYLFWMGLSAGAIGSALFSGYQSIYLNMRAGGYTHPIQFGNIALLLGTLCLIRAIFDWRNSWFNLLLILGAFSGLAASVFSQTRGGWVAIILILIWIFSKISQQWTHRRRLILLILLISAILLPVLHPNGIGQSRIKEAVIEVKMYLETGKQDTSVGARFAMWKVGVREVVKAPFWGQGDQGWIDARDAAVASGELDTFSSGVTHLHNEYLNVIFKRGVIGFVFYLGLYLVPMLFFFRPFLDHSSVEVKALAMAGMVIPMMYLDFGLTQSFLTHNSGRIVLCSLWMCTAALMLNTAEVVRAGINGKV